MVDYYIQIQGMMAIKNVGWCDFVVYVEGVYNQPTIQRIFFDEEFFVRLKNSLDVFAREYIV